MSTVFGTRLRLAVGAIWLSSVIGCAALPDTGPYPNQQRLVGKSKAALLACAGAPRKEQVRNDVTILQYYREAPMLEESAPVGKGSFPTVHHGCWAQVLIVDDHVTEVRYRFVPQSFNAANDCEDIFESCEP